MDGRGGTNGDGGGGGKVGGVEINDDTGGSTNDRGGGESNEARGAGAACPRDKAKRRAYASSPVAACAIAARRA